MLVYVFIIGLVTWWTWYKPTANFFAWTVVPYKATWTICPRKTLKTENEMIKWWFFLNTELKVTIEEGLTNNMVRIIVILFVLYGLNTLRLTSEEFISRQVMSNMICNKQNHGPVVYFSQRIHSIRQSMIWMNKIVYYLVF